jgi:hypothetical protein
MTAIHCLQIVLLLIAVAAAYHFIYEGILAPSFRLSLRFKLFALRDRVRELKMIHGDQLDSAAFGYLQDSVNTGIRILPDFTFGTLAQAKELLKNHPELRNRLAERDRLLESCRVPEVSQIWKQASGIMEQALFVNSGGWLIYVVPVGLVAAFFGFISSGVKKLLLMPQEQIDQIASIPHTAVA